MRLISFNIRCLYVSKLLQVAAFTVCALASGCMLYRWWKLGEESRKRVWRLYGWFCGLMCMGSCCGVIAWLAYMKYLVFVYQQSDTASQLLAISIVPVPYSLEFSCLSVAKLLVLDRLLRVAVPRAFILGSRRWAYAGRLVVGLIVAGNAVFVCCSVITAVYLRRSFDKYTELSAALNVSATSLASLQESTSAAAALYSIGQFCEVSVLFLIISVFSVLGVLCARRMRSALRNIPEDASEQLRGELIGVRRQILVTVCIVFLAFLLRVISSGMFAVSNRLQNGSCKKSGVSDPSLTECNVFFFLQGWMIYTPEFRMTQVFISSPLTLLITLWGMTTERSLQLMRRRELNEKPLNPGAGAGAPSSAYE
jgi:hypothetical protein